MLARGGYIIKRVSLFFLKSSIYFELNVFFFIFSPPSSPPPFRSVSGLPGPIRFSDEFCGVLRVRPVRPSPMVLIGVRFAVSGALGGADGLRHLVLAAIVRLGLLLKVLVQVHLLHAVGALAAAVHQQRAGLKLHVEGALDDGEGGLGTGRRA